MPTSLDPRLDRLEEFDRRSLNFPINDVLKSLPRRLVTKHWPCPTKLDQGNEGSCVGHAWAHELAAEPAVWKNITHEKAVGIYKLAQTLDPWPGENYQGTSVLAGIKATMQLYPKAYSSYRWAFNMKELLQTLSYVGPVVLGIRWYNSFFFPDKKTGLIEIFPGSAIAGGHAILANGISMKNRRILLHNSWGTSWGKQGNCWIAFKTLHRLLDEGGEVCVPLGRDVE